MVLHTHTHIAHKIIQNGKEKGRVNNIQQALNRGTGVGALTTASTLKFSLNTLGKTIYLRLNLVTLFSNPGRERTY